MKKVQYFPHDYNARNDPKLIEVKMDMGNSGVGIYWSLIEMLYEEGGKIEMKRIKAIAYSLNECLANVEQLLSNYDLFANDGVYFWSNSVLHRLESIENISKERRKAAKKSVKARAEIRKKLVDIQEDKTDSKSLANAEQMLSNCLINAEQINKNKINKIKEINNINNNPIGYESFSFDFVNEEFYEVFKEWLDYKRERKEKYKTQKSLELAFSKLMRLSNYDLQKAKEIVEQSMANNWAGLFELKEDGKDRRSNQQDRALQAGASAIAELFREKEEQGVD